MGDRAAWLKAALIFKMEKKAPKYQELVEWLGEKIKNKELVSGQKIPSENELSSQFHLSRQTVRHAIGILENEGRLNRIQGSGTYVSRENAGPSGNRIAVITTYVDGYIFPRMIRQVEKNLFEKGYTVQIAFTNNQVERERDILKTLIAQDDITGIIMEATKSGLPNPNRELFKELEKRKVPILFVNSYYPDQNAPHVSLNDRMAAKKITEYLISQGHQKIGGMFKLDDGQGHLRYSGYMEAMNQANLETDDEKVVWFDTKDFRHLDTSMERIEKSMEKCTAFLCYNDEVAYALIERLKRDRIYVPDDISIAGIDDSELAIMGDVKITSIANPIEEVGKMAVSNLMKMIQNYDYNGNYEFDSEVIVRGSVKRFL